MVIRANSYGLWNITLRLSAEQWLGNTGDGDGKVVSVFELFFQSSPDMGDPFELVGGKVGA